MSELTLNEKNVTIQNKLGLHARASAKLVKEAKRFASEIKLVKDNHSTNAKSIMGVMMLAASKGTELKLVAEGSDANMALEAVAALINDKFGEE
jgi:phosphocarrier protein